MKYIKTLIFIILVKMCSFSQVNDIRLYNPMIGIFKSDTSFIGAGIMVGDSTQDIVIDWVFAMWVPVSCLYLMEPGHRDSARFIFHNKVSDFPNESSSANLGKFQKGTVLYFMYKYMDSSQIYSPNFGLKLYSGQGRIGIDDYISEIGGMFGTRRSVVGKIDSNKVEIGFDADGTAFKALVFTVSGKVKIFGIETYKTPNPVAQPKTSNFTDNIIVSLSTKIVGDFEIKKSGDTIHPISADSQPSIFYTLDGSDPRSSSTKQKYSAPFKITQSTILKSYASFESDTNWFPSEVVTATYTKAVSTVKNGFRLNGISSNTISDFTIYSMSGQLLRTMTASASNVLSYTRTLPSGVYFLRSKFDGQVRRVVAGR